MNNILHCKSYNINLLFFNTMIMNYFDFNFVFMLHLKNAIQIVKCFIFISYDIISILIKFT